MYLFSYPDRYMSEYAYGWLSVCLIAYVIRWFSTCFHKRLF